MNKQEVMSFKNDYLAALQSGAEVPELIRRQILQDIATYVMGVRARTQFVDDMQVSKFDPVVAEILQYFSEDEILFSEKISVYVGNYLNLIKHNGCSMEALYQKKIIDNKLYYFSNSEQLVLEPAKCRIYLSKICFGNGVLLMEGSYKTFLCEAIMKIVYQGQQFVVDTMPVPKQERVKGCQPCEQKFRFRVEIPIAVKERERLYYAMDFNGVEYKARLAPDPRAAAIFRKGMCFIWKKGVIIRPLRNSLVIEPVGLKSFLLYHWGILKSWGLYLRRLRIRTAIIPRIIGIKQRENGLSVKALVRVPQGEITKMTLNNRDNKVADELSLMMRKVHVGPKLWYVCGDIDFQKINRPLNWDYYIVVQTKEEQVLKRLKNPIPGLMHRVRAYTEKYGKQVGANYIAPFFSKQKGLSVVYREYTEYDDACFKRRERSACRRYYLYGWLLRRKNIWLVCEKFGISAQDNARYFFEYCRSQKLQQPVYYIIDKRSKQYENVKQYEPYVLDFMSVQHMIYMLAAKVIISTDSRRHALAWNQENSMIKYKTAGKPVVMLQHGILGLKRVEHIYGKYGNNRVNIFVVASEYEKELVRQFYGYDNDEIAITGCARWDVLEDKSAGKREILVMPTWRSWLMELNEEEFRNSEYYKQYLELLNHPDLKELLTKYQCTINFYMHPKFREFTRYFAADIPGVRMISYDDEPLNELIMRCCALITDYSSVAMEVLYQSKPVLFFQFDSEEYLARQGSYLDFETELFGPRSINVSQLLRDMEVCIKTDFQLGEKEQKCREKHFKYIDKQNSKRIYDAIEHKIN